MGKSQAWQIMKLAVLSRVAIFVIQALMNVSVTPHDADAFVSPQFRSLPDRFGRILLAGFTRWDAQHFLFIAHNDYIIEQSLAFFPLFPWLTKVLANFIFLPVTAFASRQTALVLAGVLVNNFCFVQSALLLYTLTYQTFGDEAFARRCALLFCINPASIFFSTCYTEAMYCFLTLYGLKSLQERKNFLAAFVLALAGATRSNGISNLAFLIPYLLHYFWTSVNANVAELKKPVPEVQPSMTGGKASNAKVKVAKVQTMVRRSFIVRLATLTARMTDLSAQCLGSFVALLFPYAGFQAFGYVKFCTDTLLPVSMVPDADVRKFANENGFKLFYSLNTTEAARALYEKESTDPFVSDEQAFRKLMVAAEPKSPYCNWMPPFPYAYIQNHYWQVGPFNYWRIEQIPNFALAAPVVLLSAHYIWRQTKWLYDSIMVESESVSFKRHVVAFSHTAHLAALLIFGVLTMHVQVLTRFLFSSCPALIWHAARLLSEDPALKMLDEREPEIDDSSQNDKETGVETTQSKEVQEEKVTKPGQRKRKVATGCERGMETPEGPDAPKSERARFAESSRDSLLKNPLLHQFARWGELRARSKLLLGYFVVYFIVGTMMHTTFLPWT